MLASNSWQPPCFGLLNQGSQVCSATPGCTVVSLEHLNCSGHHRIRRDLPGRGPQLNKLTYGVRSCGLTTFYISTCDSHSHPEVPEDVAKGGQHSFSSHALGLRHAGWHSPHPLRSGDGAEQCADHEPVLPGASQAVSWGRCRQQTLNEATAAPASPGTC